MPNWRQVIARWVETVASEPVTPSPAGTYLRAGSSASLESEEAIQSVVMSEPPRKSPRIRNRP